jgi:hypothetical protein
MLARRRSTVHPAAKACKARVAMLRQLSLNIGSRDRGGCDSRGGRTSCRRDNIRVGDCCPPYTDGGVIASADICLSVGGPAHNPDGAVVAAVGLDLN